jgi:high-affinity nickel-transport protein
MEGGLMGHAHAQPPNAQPLNKADWIRIALLFGVITVIHVIAWGVLVVLVVPAHYTVGTKVFGLGLGVTAYTLGLRHAFDADHIAAIDNTTRKFMADGKRPVSTGFWFALGHSGMVVIMAALIAMGAHLASVLSDQSSKAHKTLGLIGTSVSGGFLYLIAILNLAAMLGILRVWRAMRQGEFDEAQLAASLDQRGLVNRLLGGLLKAISHPWQMFPIGMLFGLGFDTATEVTIMMLAGSGAASGLPWYAILVLPLLFAAGMSLFDTLDGTFMNFAYHWAFANPVRKIYYNLTVTGLSVAVAFVIGSIEIVGLLHDDAGISTPVTDWIAGLDLNNVGFIIVGLFVAVWTIAVAYWRIAKVETRMSSPPS